MSRRFSKTMTVSPRKRVHTLVRSGEMATTRHKKGEEEKEDWLSAPDFLFPQSPVLSRRVKSTKTLAAPANLSRREQNVKSRRISTLLKRLDLPIDHTSTSPTPALRRSRRQSMVLARPIVNLSQTTTTKDPKPVVDTAGNHATLSGRPSRSRLPPPKPAPQNSVTRENQARRSLRSRIPQSKSAPKISTAPKPPTIKSRSIPTLTVKKEESKMEEQPKLMRVSRRKSLRLVDSPEISYSLTSRRKSTGTPTPTKRKLFLSDSPIKLETKKHKAELPVPLKRGRPPGKKSTADLKLKYNDAGTNKKSTSPNGAISKVKSVPRVFATPPPDPRPSTKAYSTLKNKVTKKMSPQRAKVSKQVKSSTPSPDKKRGSTDDSRVFSERVTRSSSRKPPSRKVILVGDSPVPMLGSYRKTPNSKKKKKDQASSDEDLGSSPALPSARMQLTMIRGSSPLRTNKNRDPTKANTPKPTPTPSMTMKKRMRDNVDNQMNTVVTKADIHETNSNSNSSSQDSSKSSRFSFANFLWAPSTPASLPTLPPTPRSCQHSNMTTIVNSTVESRRTLLNFREDERNGSPVPPSTPPRSSTPIEPGEEETIDLSDEDDGEAETVDLSDGEDEVMDVEEESTEDVEDEKEEDVEGEEEEEEESEEEEGKENDDEEEEDSEEEEEGSESGKTKKSKKSYCSVM